MPDHTSDSAFTQLSLFDPIGVPLTRGYVAIVDPIDSDLVAFKWYATAAFNEGCIYAVRDIGGRHHKRAVHMHRLILERILGRSLLPNEQVDHRDGKGLNNTRSNLRIATPSNNLCNTRKRTDNTSGYKGVSFRSSQGKWIAQLTVQGKHHWLGAFDTPEEAYAAYCAAAMRLHGEFARLE